MKVSRLLTDPWTVGAGVFVGTLGGFALSLGPAVGVVAGVGAYLAGAVAKGLVERGETDNAALPLPAGHPARSLYERAHRAVDSIDEIAGTVTAGPLQMQIHAVRDDAHSTLSGLARLAAQTLPLEQARSRINTDLVRAELAGLRNGADEASGRALQSQLDVADRLDTARDQVLERLRSAVIGLETLVASTAEIAALGLTSGHLDSTSRITGLAEDLAGLRQGMVEAEQSVRLALAGNA